VITLAPASVQEAVELTVLAFELADRYRIPVHLLADGVIGHLMEPVTWPDISDAAPAKDWAIKESRGRERRLILAQPGIGPELLALNKVFQAKYADITRHEQRWETMSAEDAQLLVVAFGVAARVAEEAIEGLRAAGLPVGLLRPITLWPFPQQPFDALVGVRGILTVEMNTGQMVEDVRLAVNGRVPVRFYGYGGGWLPDPETVEQAVREFWVEVQP
jgi:2-oxoglutarate ferredoxin oxidoreductase subunit alpha